VSVGTPAYTKSLTAPTTATYYAQSRNTTTGCISATRLAITGIAYAMPTVTTTDAEAICATGAVTLTATASGSPTTANTYTWIVGATQATTTTNGTYSTTVLPGSTTFHVSVTMGGGCTGVGSQGTVYRCETPYVDIPGYGIIYLLQGDSPTDCSACNWSTASNYCVAHGYRLPTLDEALMLCHYKEIVPGGMGCGWLWTTSDYPNNNVYIIGTCECAIDYSTRQTSSFRWGRCVKM
jgi:hypothetical protein